MLARMAAMSAAMLPPPARGAGTAGAGAAGTGGKPGAGTAREGGENAVPWSAGAFVPAGGVRTKPARGELGRTWGGDEPVCCGTLPESGEGEDAERVPALAPAPPGPVAVSGTGAGRPDGAMDMGRGRATVAAGALGIAAGRISVWCAGTGGCGEWGRRANSTTGTSASGATAGTTGRRGDDASPAGRSGADGCMAIPPVASGSCMAAGGRGARPRPSAAVGPVAAGGVSHVGADSGAGRGTRAPTASPAIGADGARGGGTSSALGGDGVSGARAGKAGSSAQEASSADEESSQASRTWWTSARFMAVSGLGRQAAPDALPVLARGDAGIVGAKALGVDLAVEFAGALGQGAAEPVEMGFGDVVEPVVGGAAQACVGKSDQESGGVGLAPAFFGRVSSARGG